MCSWWVCSPEEFTVRLPGEQARMRRELEPKVLKRVWEKLIQQEERELRGLKTDRNPVAPEDHIVEYAEDGETDEERT